MNRTGSSLIKIERGRGIKMRELVLEKFDEDDRFIYYHPTAPIKIFNFELDMSECDINICQKLDRSEVAPILANYLEWLMLCKDKVSGYFSSKLGERLPEDWFENIEVYSASLTFITLEDFGATISFGESIFPDHIIEFYFDKYEITNDVLNG